MGDCSSCSLTDRRIESRLSVMTRSAVIGNHNARPNVIGIEGYRLDSASRNAADSFAEKHDFERDVINVARRAGQLFISFFAKNAVSYYYFYFSYFGRICTQKPGFESVRRIGFARFADESKFISSCHCVPPPGSPGWP